MSQSVHHDPANNVIVARFDGHVATVDSTNAMSRIEALSADTGSTLVLADAKTGEEIWRAPIAPLIRVRGTAFSPDSSRVVAAGGGTTTGISDTSLTHTVGMVVID